MAVTYTPPSNTVTANGPAQLQSGSSNQRTIAIFGTFPKGPDFPVVVPPQQMASVFGDPTSSTSMPYTGPYLYWFSAQQKAPIAANGGIQYLVQRLGVTRAQYVANDANAVAAFTIQGIGKYAGSAGTNLRLSIATSGSPTDQVWTLALSGTSLGGTFGLTLPGFGTITGISETSTGAQIATAVNAVLGANAVSGSGIAGTATTGAWTLTATTFLRGTLLPNFTINSTSLTGTVTSFTSTVSTPGVRPTVQSISVFDSTVSLSTALVVYKDTSQTGGTYNLNTVQSGNPNQAIVSALNGANPLSNINSIVTLTIGTSTGAPAAITTQAFTTPSITNGATNADGQGVPYTSITQAMLQSSLWTQCDYVLAGFDAALIAPTLINHFTDGLAQNDFRKAYLGPSAGTSYTTLSTSYVTAALQNDRLVIIGNDNFTAPHPALGNVPTQWDGFYLGAVAAGLKATAPQSYTGARWPVAAINQIGPSTGLSQQLIASQVTALETQGLTVFVQPLSQGTAPIQINNMITTAPYANPTNQNAVNPFYQACSRDVDDSVSRNVTGTTQSFLLQTSLSGTALQTGVSAAIKSNFSGVANITGGLNSVMTNQDPNTLALTPQVSYKLKFPTTAITNQTTFTLS